MIFKASIDVFIDVDNEAEACDVIAETLREHLHRYAPTSCIVDWSYSNPPYGPVLATESEIGAMEV